jgi:hypothetical protein
MGVFLVLAVNVRYNPHLSPVRLGSRSILKFVEKASLCRQGCNPKLVNKS